MITFYQVLLIYPDNQVTNDIGHHKIQFYIDNKVNYIRKFTNAEPSLGFYIKTYLLLICNFTGLNLGYLQLFSYLKLKRQFQFAWHPCLIWVCLIKWVGNISAVFFVRAIWIRDHLFFTDWVKRTPFSLVKSWEIDLWQAFQILMQYSSMQKI